MTPDTLTLRLRLWGYLSATHRRYCGIVEPESFDDLFEEDAEFHAVGRWGVCAFSGEYLYCAFPYFDRVAATRATLPLIKARLQTHRRTLLAVHPLNFSSVRISRMLGAIPFGVDEDGFVHYELTPDRFRRHGQEKSTPCSA